MHCPRSVNCGQAAGADPGEAGAQLTGLGAGLFDTDAQDAATADDSGLQAVLNPGMPADADADAPAARSGRRAPVAPLDDGQLAAWIDAIADHDACALTALYDATLSRVYGMVLRLVRRPAIAEDVVEDTYFQVWRQAPLFDPARGRAMTWLLGMARSRAIDAIRREARHQHDNLDADAVLQLCDPRPAADELLAAARGQADLHRALLLLNAQPRQLVAMAFLGGLSHEEFASQTALPLGTVKSQIRRALLTLRKLLGEQGPAALAT